MSDIYEFTEFQFSIMSHAANQGLVAFAVLEAAENDPKDIADKLRDEMRQIRDLIELGLLEDITHMLNEQVNVSKNNNRAYIVVKLTGQALTMFHKCKEKKWIN